MEPIVHLKQNPEWVTFVSRSLIFSEVIDEAIQKRLLRIAEKCPSGALTY